MLDLNCYEQMTGLETIQQRRGMASEKPVLLSGPGKVSFGPFPFFFVLLMLLCLQSMQVC